MSESHGAGCGCMECTQRKNRAILRLHAELQAMTTQRDTALAALKAQEAALNIHNLPRHGGIKLLTVEQDSLHTPEGARYNGDIELTFALAPEGVDTPIIFKIELETWGMLSAQVAGALIAFVDLPDTANEKGKHHA